MHLGILLVVIEMGVIDHNLQGDLAISTQNSRIHVDLGQSRGVTCLNVHLFVLKIKMQPYQ